MISLSVEFPEEEGIIRLVALPENMDETAYFWQWQVSADGSAPWCDLEEATELTLELQDTEEAGSLYYRLQARRIPAVFAARPTGTDTQPSTEPVQESEIINSDAVMPLSIGKESNIYVVDHQRNACR